MENDFQPLLIYKTKQEITNTQQLPVPHSLRICTDIFCTIITTVFALTMLIIAIVTFDIDKLAKSTYPTDVQGRYCTLDNNAYNYLYFTSPSDITKRLCVQSCPKGGENKLKCLPSDQLSCNQNSNPEFQVMIYPSIESDTSMGLICLPEDQDLKDKILRNSKLDEKFLFVSVSRSILYSALCTIGLGILFLALTAFLPGVMTYVSIILGGISCIAVGIILLILKSETLQVYEILKIIFCAILIIIGLIILVSLFFNAGDLKWCVSYLGFAGQSFSKFLPLILMVFVFYILMAGLVALMIFQTLAYWSHGQLTFIPQQVHKQLGGIFPTVMIIICGFQFFWGLAFIKQSFDFLVSGTTVYHFFKQVHYIPFALGNLFKFHWGSVAAGSFILNFFYIFDIFYDMFKPKNSRQESFLAKICCCCDRTLGFARSDTFSYVNLIGQPYCNAARLCQEIDDKSEHFQGSQSVFRYFRIGSHIMLASIGTVLTYVFMVTSHKDISVLGLIFSFLLNMFVVTFFVCLIAEMAEAILLCTLVEKYIKNQNQVSSRKYSKANKNPNISGVQGYSLHYTEE